MTGSLAFFQKELTHHLRSGRLTILGILFLLFGIMNPAVAKMTPWLLEIMADTMAESGMTVTGVTVTAMDSWVQFFKNIPMALIIFAVMESSIFTREYQTGTLVLSLTKGLPRHTVVAAKAAVLMLLWSAGYWLCWAITYGYNAYFWDNTIARHLLFSAVCWWAFGLWTVGLTVLFSCLCFTGTGVLLGTGGVALGAYLLGLLPKLRRYMPTLLTDGNSLIYGTAEAGDYLPALMVASGMLALCLAAAIPLFNKKQL